MDENLLKHLDYLRITGLKENWEAFVKQGEKGKMSHERFLRHIVTESYTIKRGYSREMRIRRAAIPEILLMETFPFALQPNLSRKRVMNIYDSFDYIHKKQNIILVGPTGCGKTGLATGYLHQALSRECTGYYVTFPRLISDLYKSMATHKEDRVLKTFASYDCLLIDEIGYVDVVPAQIGLFFRLMSMRHHRRTTIVTSNLGFSEWKTFLKNEQLTAALIDRLTENSNVINMKNCKSIRPKGTEDKSAT